VSPQPIDTSPPWWDGTIAINFSVEEWQGIITELRMLYQIPGFPENDYDIMLVNIIDRIEKNVGLE
jgi:hypothetical protein